MTKVIPITPELQPQVDEAVRRARWARRQHNLKWHGLPAGLTVLAAAGLGAGLVFGPSESNNTEQRCGIGIAEPGGGAYSVLDKAIANAGLDDTTGGYHDGARRINTIDPELHAGERFKVMFAGGRVVLDSIQPVYSPVNSCTELAAVLSPTPQNLQAS